MPSTKEVFEQFITVLEMLTRIVEAIVHCVVWMSILYLLYSCWRLYADIQEPSKHIMPTVVLGTILAIFGYFLGMFFRPRP
jgi:hypothetical protein